MHCAGISRVNVAVQGLLSLGSVKPEVNVTLDWRDSEKCVTFVTKKGMQNCIAMLFRKYPNK